MTLSTTILRAATLAAAFSRDRRSRPVPAHGVWIDHTGRGAVEIAECGGALCGHVVWVKDAKHIKTCRNQILGNVKPVGGNTWDRGWIVDPDDNARYSVELKPVGEDRLRVVGYMGSKLFSETMMWRRAPADLKRCDQKETVTPVAAPSGPPVVFVPPVGPPPSAAARRPRQSPRSRPRQPHRPLRQREASAPAVIAPAPRRLPRSRAWPLPCPPVRRRPRSPKPRCRPSPNRRGRRASGGGRKSAAKDCTLDLPYITRQNSLQRILRRSCTKRDYLGRPATGARRPDRLNKPPQRR